MTPAGQPGWWPFWAMVGVALPISFAGQVESATKFLAPHELVGLYGTDWLLYGALGLVATGVCTAVDALAARLWRRCPSAILSRAAFATLTILTLIAGMITWLRSVAPDEWLPATYPTAVLGAVALLGGGYCALRARYAPVLHRLAAVAAWAGVVGAVAALGVLAGAATTPRAAAAQASGSPVPGGPGRRSIVLITVDALAAEHTTLYGSRRPTTPGLEALAAHGVTLDHFYANSNYTTPAVSSILTGLNPWTHRALQLPGIPRAGTREDSLPAVLRRAGYRTAYFGSNSWAGATRLGLADYFDGAGPNYRGLTTCYDRLSRWFPLQCAAIYLNGQLNATVIGATQAYEALTGQPANNVRDPELALGAASAWIAAHPGEPVFVWVHLLAPHDPYAAPPPFLGLFSASPLARGPGDSEPQLMFQAARSRADTEQVLEARYDESIRYVDHAVGTFLDRIRARMPADTAILVSADHGESFDHGYGGHAGPMLYQQLIAIPLVIDAPGLVPVGARRTAPGSQIDLAPTIAALAGIAPAKGWEGRSLLGDAPAEERAIFSMNFQQSSARGVLDTGSVAMVKGTWKIVMYLGHVSYPQMPTLTTELYDLATDPAEHHNLAAERPDLVAELGTQLMAEFRRHAAVPAT